MQIYIWTHTGVCMGAGLLIENDWDTDNSEEKRMQGQSSETVSQARSGVVQGMSRVRFEKTQMRKNKQTNKTEKYANFKSKQNF